MSLKERSDVNPADTWDLSALFESEVAWSKQYSDVEGQINKLAAFQGILLKDSATLLSALEMYFSFHRAIIKLYTFAQLRACEDLTNAEYLNLQDRALGLYSRFLSVTSYISPEILAADQHKLTKLLNSVELKPYKRYLTDLVRDKPHTLSHAEENLLAGGTEVFATTSKIFGALNDADFSFGEIEYGGQMQPLTHSSFAMFLKVPEREIRKQAFFQYYKVYNEHRHALTQALVGSFKKDSYISRVRNFDSARAAALHPDDVPQAVYDNLVSTIHKGADGLKNYYQLRQRRLGLADLQFYDLYVPLISEVKFEFNFNQACEILIESVKPLGAEYTEILAAGLGERRWVDRYENRGKRSGAFSSGCYDSQPYILMNFKENEINDLFTLAHEAGHSMHSFFSRREQSYQDSDYPIFVAEVASTFNEQLLIDFLLKRYNQDREKKKYLLNYQLEQIRQTIFRQTMFAEFESIAHKQIDQGGALAYEDIAKIYGELLQKYFGDSVLLPEELRLEALRIPHFYSPFYVYKYATGLAAAIALSQRVIAGDQKATEKYLGFLSSGCTKYPIELLKDAGVDMSSQEPIENALEIFKKTILEFEALS